jgi:3-dehydroquinate synthase
MSQEQSISNSIEFGNLGEASFETQLTSLNASKFLLFCDENTRESCAEYLITNFEILFFAEVIEIPCGEESKSIEIYVQLLETLAELEIDRNAVIINVGGGVVTDLGGFVASTYKRGIRFINIPTSLLGMVDASIGGKNGIDLGALKNLVGTFTLPIATYIDEHFLNTLPENEIKNGYAEMLKHALISSKNATNELISFNPNDLQQIKKRIEASATVKINIVAQDPKEENIRANLNLGHTTGHAIESFALENHLPFSHGHGVALGIRIALRLSNIKLGLAPENYASVDNYLANHYPTPSWIKANLPAILNNLKYDKKNQNGKLKFVLLQNIGSASFGQEISLMEVESAFNALFES